VGLGTVYDAANNGSTLIANINSRASNELCNLIFILTAEGNNEEAFERTCSFHPCARKSTMDDVLCGILPMTPDLA